jgi:hypothetical protein
VVVVGWDIVDLQGSFMRPAGSRTLDALSTE